MKHLFEALGLLWGITNGGESMDYKAVLVMACELKQGPLDQNKDVVLMRPLRDMNFPKFVFEVFLGLIGDFFPGLDCPRVHYPKFNDAMEGVPSDGKHIQLPHRVGKIVQTMLKWLHLHDGGLNWKGLGSCGGMIDTYVKQQAQLPGLLDLGRSPPTTSTVQYSFAAQVGAVLLPTMNVSPAIPPWMCRGAWKPVWKRHNSLQWISRMFRIYPSKATMELYDHAPSKFDCIFNLRDIATVLEVAVPIASCEQSTLETAPMRKLPGASNKTKPEKVVLKYVVVQLGCGNVLWDLRLHWK
eukprot:Em0009g384a